MQLVFILPPIWLRALNFGSEDFEVLGEEEISKFIESFFDKLGRSLTIRDPVRSAG